MELSGYNKILVDRFLNRPNVKRNDNTISFYQLYCEIRNYFNECYSKAYYNEKLVNKINNISSNKNISIKNISSLKRYFWIKREGNLKTIEN